MSNLIARIEYYRDENIEKPKAYAQLKYRVPMIDYDKWKTVILDSTTFMEFSARKRDEYLLNPGVKDGRQHYAASKNAIEEMLYVGLGDLPMNVVVICHIDEDKDELHGQMVRTPALPGKLTRRIGAAFQEVYRTFIFRDGGTGEPKYGLQTGPDGMHQATGQLRAPNPCWPHYDNLWKNWEKEKQPIHVLVYGDYGSGKSTFATTFPKPLLVLCFDKTGKDIPYLRLGREEPRKEMELGNTKLFYREVFTSEDKEEENEQSEIGKG